MSHGGVDELERMRCERGADIARGIGLDEDAATAITQLFEHWDGNGHPGERAGEEISLLARMACLSQTMEVFWQQGGAAAACDVARARRGTWFDPTLVDAVDELERDVCFWASLETPDVQAVEPADRVAARRRRAPGPRRRGLRGHRRRQVALHRAPLRGRGRDRRRHRRARWASTTRPGGSCAAPRCCTTSASSASPTASSTSPARSSDGEWGAVRRHPRLSMVILRAVPALAPVARLSATHHERLDGSGYPYGLTASELKLPDRILQVADVTDALTAERPYREALSPDEVPGHHALRRRQAPRRQRLRGRRVVAAPAGPRAVTVVA